LQIQGKEGTKKIGSSRTAYCCGIKFDDEVS